MATIGDAMVTLLTTNWAGAGAAPRFEHLVDHPSDIPPSQEQVIVRLPIHEDVTPINDTYSNFKYTIQIRVKSNVSDDRLKVLADEVIRIVNTYAITGITRQFAKRGENTSDRKKQVFAYDVWAICEEHMSTAGTSYSSPGAGDVPFPADVTIAGDLEVTGEFSFDTGEHVDVILDEDDMTSDDEDALATQQSIKAYCDKHLMIGSANAAYISLALWGHKLFSYARSSFGYVENIGADDINMDLVLTQPCTKGGLKLHISNLKFGVKDSDAADYITTVRIHGINANDAVVQMDIDTTNHTSIGDKTFAGAVMPAAAMDCSGYQTIIVSVGCTNSAVTAEMDIGNFRMECYYAA